MRMRHWVPLLATVAILSACKRSSSDTEGSAGADCRAATDCAKGLTCTLGFCTPSGCAAGDEGCACGAGGVCGLAGAAPLSCLSNICTAARTPSPGTLGGSCASSSPLGVACTGGPGLVCVDGACQELGCPSGTVGCPCGPFGRCEPQDGREARCREGVCVVAGCTDGAWGCRCDSGTPCASGLDCVEGLCRSPRSVLTVASGSVRACDLLVEVVRESAVMRFGTGATGEVVRRGVRRGVSAISVADAPLGDALSIEQPAASPAPRLLAGTCYDGTGQVVASPGLALH